MMRGTHILLDFISYQHDEWRIEKNLISNMKSMKETVVCGFSFSGVVGSYFYYSENISNIKHYSEHILLS